MITDSNTLKAIIADDESLARDVIKKYIADFPDIIIIAECENGLAALNSINQLNPDIIFLDIQMPELDGLSMLSELKDLPLVIFTTAYNQYAIKAFEISAVDYLLKPFDKERFASAIQKVLARKNPAGHIQKQISDLQNSLTDYINAGKKFITRMLIKGNDAYSFLNLNDITWFEADSDYVKIHAKGKSYLKNISLNELEKKLDPAVFIRIHRSTIVNISYIKEMKPYFNGEYYLYLTGGEKLKLSRSYKDKIRLIIGESI